jgi:hypothetical protein
MVIVNITEKGKQLARSINTPDTPDWRIIHHLDLVGSATSDQLRPIAGEDSGMYIRKLERLGLVTMS